LGSSESGGFGLYCGYLLGFGLWRHFRIGLTLVY